LTHHWSNAGCVWRRKRCLPSLQKGERKPELGQGNWQIAVFFLRVEALSYLHLGSMGTLITGCTFRCQSK